MSRVVDIERSTNETKIKIRLNLDGKGESDISTKIGFFDHMLTQVSRHGFIDLVINADGDTFVDCHHTIEDVGIVLGGAIFQALGDKKGIARYGHSIIPMDETLVLCAVDISGRAFLNFDAAFTTGAIGGFDTEMMEEFFRAVSVHSGMNIHIKQLAGKNNHHIAECIFKAFGRALSMAVSFDNRVEGVMSTKGML